MYCCPFPECISASTEESDDTRPWADSLDPVENVDTIAFHAMRVELKRR